MLGFLKRTTLPAVLLLLVGLSAVVVAIVMQREYRGKGFEFVLSSVDRQHVSDMYKRLGVLKGKEILITQSNYVYLVDKFPGTSDYIRYFKRVGDGVPTGVNFSNYGYEMTFTLSIAEIVSPFDSSYGHYAALFLLQE